MSTLLLVTSLTSWLTWLLPQVPMVRRPEKASTDLFQGATEFPQSPPQLPSSGCGCVPSPKPNHSLLSQQQTVPADLEPACKADWRVKEPKRQSCAFGPLQHSTPHHSLSPALQSKNLFHETPLERMGFCDQALETVFKRMAIQITDTSLQEQPWFDWQSSGLFHQTLRAASDTSTLSSVWAYSKSLQHKPAPKIRDLQ